MTQPRTRGGMAIVAIALAVVVVIAGVILVAWLLLRDSDRVGAADPVAAVDSFLAAVYRDLDAAEANAQTCAEARDQAAMQVKIDSIRAHQDAHPDPRFRWSTPQVLEESDELALVEVTLTMITGDERAADQTLHISVLDKDADGWWVCNVDSVTGGDSGTDGGEPHGGAG